ncbi:MAG: hypothetical protein KJO21_09655, partial [Verrucomicrobiae bacterium]|nr:hypothetical protein [Verrucomicrobiae bacterium]
MIGEFTGKALHQRNLTEKLPTTSEIAVVKYPECIYLIFQGGLFRLLKGFPLFSKKTAYLFKQP